MASRLEKPPAGIARRAEQLKAFARQAEKQAPTNIFAGDSEEERKRKRARAAIGAQFKRAPGR